MDINWPTAFVLAVAIVGPLLLIAFVAWLVARQ